MTLIAGKLPIVGLLDMLGGGHPHSSREQTMEVNKISANIRYSQDTGKGAWKVVAQSMALLGGYVLGR